MTMTASEIREKLKQYICRAILKNPDYPLTPQDRLVSGGLIDSYSLVTLAVFIEGEFGVRIPDTELNLDNMDTIDLMTDRILKELPSDDPV